MTHPHLLQEFRRRALRPVIVTIGFASLFVNVLTLAVPIYMIQLFDRVLASQSESSLLYLTLAAAWALLTYAVLDMLRSRILSGAGKAMEERLGSELLERVIEARCEGRSDGVQPLRNLAQVRQFLSGPLVLPLFDAPWVPVYLTVIFLLHPMLGSIALGGALVLLATAIVNEVATRRPLKTANKKWGEAIRVAEEAVRNASVVEAMGLGESIVRRWKASDEESLLYHNEAGAWSSAFAAMSKFIRLLLQILMLGSGAYLVIHAELSPGAMIAGSILLSRGLQPVEQAIGAWKSLLSAREAYEGLGEFITKPRARRIAMSLPDPRGHLSIEKVSTGVLKHVSFQLKPGEVLALMGPSGAGKSTMARLIMGLLKPTHGTVRLDGADVFHWDRSHFGAHVGYLPQEIDLFADATVAENIARMKPIDHGGSGFPAYSKKVSTQITEAARLADVHEMVLGLPEGYWTLVRKLSGGQRQRVALARALFRQPRLLVLDEPDSNLDKDGKMALVRTLGLMKKQECTVVLVTHEIPLLALADKVLVLRDGSIQKLGPTGQFIATPNPRNAA